tara:strand:- start:343 stop:1032 length:690 start_codon:yes stop_codon:yes gene_type:complete
MKISILKCGPGIGEIKEKHGHASDWVTKIIQNQNEAIEISVVDSYRCLSPDFNDNAWILTGSSSSCYEDKDWIVELEILIRRGYELNIPMLGICFGHQIISQALGGKVVKNSRGWELGSNKIKKTTAGKESSIFKSIPLDNDYYFSHQDVVIELPKNAIELACNEMGNQAYSVGNNIYGVQFHPEFSYEVMDSYVKRRMEMGIIPKNPFISKQNTSYLVINNFINLLEE